MLYRATRLLVLAAAVSAAFACIIYLDGMDRVSAGAPTRTLEVNSGPITGIPILMSIDGGAAVEVVTNYTEHPEQGSSVTLTAPATFQNRPFFEWWKDGFNFYSDQLSISFTLNQSASFFAIYGAPKFTLNVTSSPETGIEFLNEDIVTLATPYERTFEQEETYEAIINAPVTHNGKPFARWMLNGEEASKLHVINIMMDKDYELEAQYGSGSITCKIQPKAARKKARWRVDGGPWMKKGTTVSGLLVGKHKIEWLPVPGFQTPNPRNVPIDDGDDHTIRGRYFPEE
ncbi:MAG: hypothetical protein IT367_07175 [Candidatus Hydrogenedentes bacterium]|nr:hypothetical protein [Candidatus Hydrogenedentota bacterium]